MKIYKKTKPMVGCCVLLMFLFSCGLPDREDPVLPQEVSLVDSGHSGHVSGPEDAGMGPGTHTDAGQSMSLLNDAGADLLEDDSGAGISTPAFDAGQTQVEQPCDSSTDCFSDAPFCDPSTGICAQCEIECSANSHCEVDALEVQSCVCDLDYIDDGNGVCIAQCSSNDMCDELQNPICDGITGLCRGCVIGECLSAASPVCNELSGECWDPCGDLGCHLYLNNQCTVSFSGDSASCECVTGASPADASAGEGDCLFDNQCLTNADCSDATIPVCNDQGGCSNPCDTTDCDANEICALDGDLAALCDCDAGYFRSTNSSCILNGACGGNADCDLAIPLCEASVCTDPCTDACSANQDCIVLSDLSPLCSCSTNYQDLNNDNVCKPTCDITNCAVEANCSYDDGTAICTCGTGFEGDGFSCSDIDGCANAPCAANVTCTDVPAPGTGYSCGNCPEGYVGNGDTCDIDMYDDCASNPCSNGGTCTDLGLLDFECDCSGTGFSGALCNTNIDDCNANQCGPGGTCSDGVNSYTCTCANGYSGGGIQNPCVDIDECAGNPCGIGGICSTPSVNMYQCTCSGGYTGGGTNNACTVDYNDDCGANTCGSGGTCTDTGVNSFSCICASGYFGGGNNTGCAVDYSDDCSPNPCANNGSCSDTGVNSHSCDCSAFYTGANCQTDVNECNSNNGGCQVNCSNQVGGPPLCSCNPGQVLDTDGTSCVECVDNDDCQGAQPNCNSITNTCYGCTSAYDCADNTTLTQCQGYTGPASGEGDMGHEGGSMGHGSQENQGSIEDDDGESFVPDEPGGGFQYGSCVACTTNAHCNYYLPPGWANACSGSPFYECHSMSVPCPSHSTLAYDQSNQRTCNCNSGWFGNISWNANSESWSGSCYTDIRD